MLSFQPTFSLSSFTSIKRLFSSSSLSAIRVVSSAYLRLLKFLPQSWFQLVICQPQHFSWYTLPTMYGCESWTIKKAECRRIDAFEMWGWRRLLRVPWIARRSNQSILKEISPEYSLKGLMLKLKLNTLATWWEELTHWKRPWDWERLKAGGEGDDRGWDGWMASPTQLAWVWVNSRSWWWSGRPGMLQSMGSQRVRHDWATELN